MEQRDPPIQIPGYELLRVVGEGGMAAVWKARQTSLNRVVALKILHADRHRDEQDKERFRREAHAAACLNHQHIVQVHDAGEHAGRMYLTMEYVAGETVGAWLDRVGAIDEREALDVAESVAEALRYAWDEAHIIHCDVKPDNLLIDPDGTVKITDLGLAEFIETRRHAQDDRADVLGTPHYCSPEQAAGAADLDCRTDIYALGAMLYHMVTGRLPFDGQSASRILEAQLYDTLPASRTLRPELSNAMVLLIEKLMVRDREQRYAGWDAVLEDLQRVRGGERPAQPWPDPGVSTVETDTAARKPAEKGRPRVRLSRPAAALPRPRKRHAPGDHLREALLSLLLLVFLAGAAYTGLGFFFLHDDGEEDASAGREPALPHQPRVAGTRRMVDVAGAMQAEAGGESARAERPGEFGRAAEQYNRAVALMKRYRSGERNADLLQKVEALAREAAESFEALVGRMPPDKPVARYRDQCYRLIAEARQRDLMDNGLDGSAGTLTLWAAGWQEAAVPTHPAVRRLAGVLKPEVEPDDRMPSYREATTLYPPLEYGMPLAQAVGKLDRPAGTEQPVRSPCFPQDSLFLREVYGDFGNGFNRLVLVLDRSDRVVAVQLESDQPPRLPWFRPDRYIEGPAPVNFLRPSVSSPQGRVAYRVRTSGDTLRIDSERVTRDPGAFYEIGPPRERISLFLPKPVAQNLLYRALKVRPGT